jgi:mRNA-degrading endonuclease RelE of RelBE toxin-antitoxin system
MNFDETDEFSKDFKRLSKKYKSLVDDLLEFKKVVSKFPLGTDKHFVVLIEKETVKIIKGRLFCRYLKGSSLRIIYAYCENNHRVEFMQLYFKGDKENEDHNRIKNYLSNFK